MDKSRIEWTDSTWNPITGCTQISSGCQNCYALRMTRRLQAMGIPAYKDGFSVRCHQEALSLPSKWKKPRTVFVNSMSDIFHKDVPTAFIQDIFDVMNSVNRHIYQILTKRAERLPEIDSLVRWSDNIWMGVTVENQECTRRIEFLRQTKAAVKFLSMEPLLEPVHDLDLSGIDWVIVGGESGPGARPMQAEWVREIKYACELANVPFFFKQWGGIQKKKNGRLLDNQIYNEMPHSLELELV